MGSRYSNSMHQRYGGRPSQTRPPLPVVMVVCDDTKTAVAYFNELQREVKAKVTVRVVPARRCGATPEEVLRTAHEIAKTFVSREKVRGDSIWALLDTEAEEYKQKQAEQAKQQAGGSRVQVLLSKPCYEVWTLAHLIDTGETFNDCNAVGARIKAEWKKMFGIGFGNKKSQADYTKLMPLRAEAVKNARKRVLSRDPSWTEVYKAVEAILSLYNARMP